MTTPFLASSASSEHKRSSVPRLCSGHIACRTQIGLGTLGHNQHCQTSAVSRTFAAISSVLLTCADAVPPTPQARADIVELIDFAQDRFKRHGQTALSLNSLRRENFR